MDRDEVEAYKHAKKERGQYTAILNEQGWSIKELSRAGKIAPSCPLTEPVIFALSIAISGQTNT